MTTETLATNNMETYSTMTENVMTDRLMTTISMTTDSMITSEANDITSTNKGVKIGMLTDTCNKGNIFSVAIPILSSLLGFMTTCCMCFCSCYLKKRAQLKDLKKDDTNQVNRKSRKSKKKYDDVNVLVREANTEAESVITGLREETAQ